MIMNYFFKKRTAKEASEASSKSEGSSIEVTESFVLSSEMKEFVSPLELNG